MAHLSNWVLQVPIGTGGILKIQGIKSMAIPGTA